MKVCFISASWVREREILSALNKKTDLLFICPYQKNGNYTLEDVSSYCKTNRINFIIDDFSHHRARSFKKLRDDYTLVKRIKKFNPDVIYIETLVSPYFAIFSRLFLGNKKSIIAIMDFKLHQRSKGNFKFSEKFYRNFQLKFYKYFQFFSYSQEKLFKKEYPNKKSFTIRLFLVGTDLPIIKSKQTEKPINFFYFGRIFYYKGVDILIKAANILAEKRTDFELTIAGSCTNWEEYYSPLIKNEKVFDLKIRHITKEELPDLFNKASFLLAPYREVTQSGPLLRGYYYNLIPITSDEDGFTEYITNEKTGFLYKNGSAIGLANAMEKALNLSNNEKEYIINNIEAFKETEFNIDNVIEKYIAMYNAI